MALTESQDACGTFDNCVSKFELFQIYVEIRIQEGKSRVWLGS